MVYDIICNYIDSCLRGLQFYVMLPRGKDVSDPEFYFKLAVMWINRTKRKKSKWVNRFGVLKSCWSSAGVLNVGDVTVSSFKSTIAELSCMNGFPNIIMLVYLISYQYLYCAVWSPIWIVASVWPCILTGLELTPTSFTLAGSIALLVSLLNSSWFITFALDPVLTRTSTFIPSTVSCKCGSKLLVTLFLVLVKSISTSWTVSTLWFMSRDSCFSMSILFEREPTSPMVFFCVWLFLFCGGVRGVSIETGAFQVVCSAR